MILPDQIGQVVELRRETKLDVLAVGDDIAAPCQHVLRLLGEHHAQHPQRLIPASPVIFKIPVERNLKGRVGQQPLLAVFAEVWQHDRVDAVLLPERSDIGTARANDRGLALPEHPDVGGVGQLHVLRLHARIPDEPLHALKCLRPDHAVQPVFLLIGVLVEASPDLSLHGIDLRDRESLQDLHAGVVVEKVTGKAADSDLLERIACGDEALVIRRQRDAVLFKQIAVRHKPIHLTAQRQPVDRAVRVDKALQVGLIDRSGLLRRGQIHQMAGQVRRIVQRKASAGDDVRQRALFHHEFVEVEIVVAHDELDVHIRQLCLDVGRIGAVERVAPQIHGDGVRLFQIVLPRSKIQREQSRSTEQHGRQHVSSLHSDPLPLRR